MLAVADCLDGDAAADVWWPGVGWPAQFASCAEIWIGAVGKCGVRKYTLTVADILIFCRKQQIACVRKTRGCAGVPDPRCCCQQLLSVHRSTLTKTH